LSAGDQLRFAYADPPYLGLSSKYYRREPDFAGEVDHGGLLSSLEERRQGGEIAGWALSASSTSVATLLPLMPAGTKLCVWVKLVGPGDGSRHDFWEALFVVGGRPWRPGFSNVLLAAPARGGHHRLVGRKPLRFCAWLFEALGMLPGDELDDLFPGTGGVATAWAESCRRAERPRRRCELEATATPANP
jgi:hypothetical protein